MSLHIEIKTVPHKEQRYPTVGDWQFQDASDLVWQVSVSELDDWRMEVAVAIHEVIECALSKYNGISQAMVDTWDQTYEGDAEEPGDDPECPYHKEHSMATGIERIVVAELGIPWTKYEDRIHALELHKRNR